MKKRMLAVMLPVAAFVALAGTGFGVWVFNSTTAASDSADFIVTNAVSVDSVKVAVSGELTLDQEGSDAETILDTNNTISLALSADYTGLTGVEGKYTDKYTYTDVTAASAIKFNYDVKTEIKGGLATYVKLATLTGDDKVEVASASTDEATAKTLAVKFAWVEGAKPTTKDEYNTMVSAIKNSGEINFTVTLTDLAVAA
jgi:hypothetical protein